MTWVDNPPVREGPRPLMVSQRGVRGLLHTQIRWLHSVVVLRAFGKLVSFSALLGKLEHMSVHFLDLSFKQVLLLFFFLGVVGLSVAIFNSVLFCRDAAGLFPRCCCPDLRDYGWGGVAHCLCECF